MRNKLRQIQEHLEALQRDVHGLEYSHWKEEVDGLWKGVFEQIGRMSAGPQQSSLQLIKEHWIMYLTHYVATAG